MSVIPVITSCGSILLAGIEWPVVSGDCLSVLLSSLKYNPEHPLQLPSVFTLTFLLVLFPALALCSGRPKVRKWLLILASLYLYYKLSGAWVLLLVLLAVATWLLALRGNTGQKPVWPVVVTVVLNLLLLVLFKAGGVFGSCLGIEFFPAGLVIPAGISFFCFQSISYVVDCRRGRISPLRSFPDVLLLLAYFPKMFLGPLVKNKDFIASIQHPHLTVTASERAGAIRRAAFGIVKFCVLSRIIGRFLVDPVFSDPASAPAPVCLLAVYAYTFQLYCDFSGYTDLAIGLSCFIGLPLPENFALPYHSASITEFWRRWHISLSSWLKDYLYISLGGNRKGRFRTYANLLITMVLGGLWHGVGLMFLLWGLWHGLLLCLHKLMLGIDKPFTKYWFAKTGSTMKLFPRAVGVFLTFNAVAFGWLMFRSPDWGTFSALTQGIFSDWSVPAWSYLLAQTSAVSPDLSTAASLAIPVAALVAAALTHFLPSGALTLSDRILERSGFAIQVLVLVLAIWLAFQTTAVLFPGTASALPVYANF